MPLVFDIVADWDGDGFFHREAKVGDEQNRFGIAAIDIASLPFMWSASSSIATSDTASLYGLSQVTWTVGTPAGAWLDIGRDAVTHTVNFKFKDSVTAILWVKANSIADAGIGITMSIYRDDVSIGSKVFTITGTGWNKLVLEVSGLDNTLRNWHIRVQRTSLGSISNVYQIAGPMLLNCTEAEAPYGFNSGALSTYDNLTPLCREASWQIGFNAPYNSVCAAGVLTIQLDNTSKRFSPEFAAGALYGYLGPRKEVRVYGMQVPDHESRDATIDAQLFRGWVQAVSVEPGVGKEATIECRDMRSLMDGLKIFLPPQISVDVFDIAQVIMNSLPLPYGELPATPTYPPRDYTPDVYPYALDNIPDEGTDALRVFQDILGPSQAKLIFDRSGGWRVYDLRDMMTYADALEINNTFPTGDYVYGDRIINSAVVTAYPRKVSVATDKILWTLAQPETLDPGEDAEIRVRYKTPDADNVRSVSALGPYLANVVKDAEISVALTATSKSAAITAVNADTTGSKTITSMEVRGQKLTAYDEIDVRRENADSIAEYGVYAQEFNYRLLSERKKAKRLALYMVGRFGRARGEFRSITLDLTEDTQRETDLLTKTLMSSVMITDDQTLHGSYSDEPYKIIGEQWSLGAALRDIRVTYVLEPVYRAFTLDDDILGKLDNNVMFAMY